MTLHGMSLPRLASRHRMLVSALAGIVFLAMSDPTGPSLLLSLPLVLAGEGIRVWATGHIDKNRRVTREGPYSLSRNPLYIGNFLIGCGFMVAAADAMLAALFLVFFATLYVFTVSYEESFLAEKFPVEWPEYAGSVPRWFGLASLTGYVPGTFRLSQVGHHREWRNLPVIAAVYVILLVKALLGGRLP